MGHGFKLEKIGFTMWDKLENQVADEFESLDSDKSQFMKKQFAKRVYTGEINRVWKEVLNDPWLEEVYDEQNRLYSQVSKMKKGRHYTQTTLRAVLYLRDMEKYFDLNKIKWITDFGPGYGGFIRVWHKLFTNTQYQLVDLPRLHQISQHYLNMYDIPAEWNTLENHQSPKDVSLFMATHSLNECQMETRDQVEKILPEYDYIYIVYNDFCDGINNLEYFQYLGEQLHNTHTVHLYFDKKATHKWRLIAIK